MLDGAFGVGLLLRRHGDLHAIAGGQDHAFEQPRTLLQVSQRFGKQAFLEGQPLAHLHRRGAMIQSCDEQLHLSRAGRSPTCAAHVSAAQPSTASAMTAAFRPRQPAEVRRKIITRHSSQVNKENWTFGSLIQRVRIRPTPRSPRR